MGYLMLKDHKSAIHQEGVTFDKVIRNSNGTEQILNFLLFNNCQLEIMRFIHSFDNMFLFSNHNVTRINVSKQYKENRGVRAFLTVRKLQINLLSSSYFLPKIVPLIGTVPFTYFMGYSESILSIGCKVNQHFAKRIQNEIRNAVDNGRLRRDKCRIPPRRDFSIYERTSAVAWGTNVVVSFSLFFFFLGGGGMGVVFFK